MASRRGQDYVKIAVRRVNGLSTEGFGRNAMRY